MPVLPIHSRHRVDYTGADASSICAMSHFPSARFDPSQSSAGESDES